MRVHYLHLQRSDFTLSNSNRTWQSAVVDLYDNSSYSNYSLVRSNYGLGAIEPMLESTPNNVWVGMQVVGQNGADTITDGGIIRGDRYIDTTGLINLISYNVTTPEYSASCSLDVYQAESSSAIFPGEWVANPGNSIQDGLDFLTNSPRYLVLVLNWNYDPGTVDFFLRVEIDGPVMAPKYRETGAMLAKLPTWMAMSESDYVPATPELATPQSVGGAFLNAIAGEWMDDLFNQITYRNLQLFIDTADVNQMAWCYKTDGPPLYPYSFVGDGVQCTVAYNTWEFYRADPDDDIVLWDEVGKSVYSNKHYSNFTINGTAYAQAPFQVWNAFDDLGLLVSLNRLSEESNSDFRSRILDVYVNQPGVGVENFKNAVRRELSLWQFYGSTPDSNFVGATPEVLEISDLENDPIYTQPNGLPTSRFIQLANYLATQYPTTWGQFRWDSAYADLSDDTFSGYGVLPLMYDATPWADEQSGIGDQRDLLIYPPAPLAGPHDFGAQLSLRGVNYTDQTQYAPIEVNVTVTPQGDKTLYTNPIETVWFTITFTRYDSTEVDYFSFQLSSTSDIEYAGATPTSASIAAFRIFDSQGVTVPDIFLRNAATGNMTGNRLLLTDVASIRITVGQWDPTSQDYINTPAAGTYKAWVSVGSSEVESFEFEISSDNPTGYWPLNDAVGSTSATNIAGSGNGVVNGSVVFGQPGPIVSDSSQTAALFDGLNSYIETSTSIAPSTFSLEAWYRTRQGPNLLPSGDAQVSAGNLGSWVNGYNANLTAVASPTLTGNGSIEFWSGASSGGGVLFGTQGGSFNATGPGPVTVTPGQSYVAMAAFRAGSEARTPGFVVRHFDSAGSNFATTSPTAATWDNPNWWSFAVGIFTAPAGAVTSGLVMDVGDFTVNSKTGGRLDSQISAPTMNSPTTATTGGNVPASTTRYYTVTAVNAYGETTASNEVSVTTGSGTATNANTLVWTPPTAPYGSSNNLIYDNRFTHALDATQPTWYLQETGGGSYSVSNGSIYWTAGASTGNAYPISLPIQMMAGDQYTLSCYLSNPAGASAGIRASLVTENIFSSIAIAPAVAPGTASTQYVTFTCPSALQLTMMDIGGLAVNIPLDDPSGSTSASGWNASTVSGSVEFYAGGSPDNYAGDKSTLFEGGYITGPLWLGQTNGFTWSTWVYLSGTGHGCLMCNGDEDNGTVTGVALGIGSGTYETDGTNVIVVYNGVRWIDTGHALSEGAWHHIALRVDSNGYPWVYVDGTQAYTDTGAGPVAPAAGTTSYLGTDPVSTTVRTLTAGFAYQAQIGVYNTDIGAGNVSRIYSAANGTPTMRMLPFDTGTMTIPNGAQIEAYGPQVYSGFYDGRDQTGPIFTFNVYEGTASGGEHLLNQGDTACYYVDTQSSNAATTNPAAPTTNTTAEVHYATCFGIFPGDTLGYQLEVLSDSPAGYWPYTDPAASTTTKNAVGSGDLTVGNSPIFGVPGPIVSDPSQTAVTLDGSTQSISTALNLLESSPPGVTVECWFRTTASGCLAAYLDNGANNYVSLQVNGNGTAHVGIETQGSYRTFDSAGAYDDGEWHHIAAAVTAGGSAVLFVDGVEVGSVGGITTWDFANSTNYVETGILYGGGFFAGSLAHVAVYPAALSAARIQAHYNAALNTAGQIVQGWQPPSYLTIADSGVMGSSNGIGMWINESAQLEGAFGNGTNSYAVIDSAITDNKWHQGVVTYDGNTLRLYRDGSEVTSIAASGAVTFANNLRIGAFSGSVSNIFQGDLAQVAVYANAVLSADRVMSHYQAALTQFAVTVANNSATPTTLVPPVLYMQSQVTQTATATWNGDPVHLTLLVNNTGNLTSSSPGTIRIPPIYWDNYVTSSRALSVALDSANILNLDGTSTPLTSGVFTVSLTNPSNGAVYTSGSLTTSRSLVNSVLSTSNPIGLQLSLDSATNYPISGTTATAFTALLPYAIDGTVDINGPWVNGYAPAAGNSNYLLGTYSFTPGDFGVTGSYSLDWIGVQTLNDESVVTWLGSNVPTLDNGSLTVNLYARLSPEPLPQWNPNVHAGTYYEENLENYLYINPQTVSFSGGSVVLPTTVQQGAPVYVYPDPAATPNYFYRQVAFFDYDATPYQLTLLNKEVVSGNGTSNLYAAYPRINLLSVVDITDPNNQVTLSAPYYNETNVIPVGVVTDSTHSYQLTYEVVDSFYVDNNYQGTAATPTVSGYELATPGEDDTQPPRAVIVASNPQPAWAIYESSVYATSTPTSVALNPLYTAIEEGFIYLSHDDFSLDHFVISISPSSVSADGEDYALLSVYGYDVYGNPVPRQSCTVSSQYVLINGGYSYSFNTDLEGHAVVILTAPSSIPHPYVEDTIVVSSLVEATPVSASTSLMVQSPAAAAPVLRGSPTQASIRANGTDLQVVFGHLVDANQNPVTGATVTWNKARTNYDLFAAGGDIAASGSVTTDASGNFAIGPFASSVVPGYWLMSIQAQGYDAGDVVFWLEYPDNTFGVETIQGLPTLPVQLATPVGALPSYISGWMHPVYYNDASPVNPITPNLQPNWLPPNWYALPQFEQWQIGLFSSIGTAGDWSTYINVSTPNHPPQANG